MSLSATIGAMRSHRGLSNGLVFIPLSYLALALAYLLFPRRELLLGMVSLAAMHTLRIIAGNAATDIPTSSWLLALSMVLFPGLATVERSAEPSIVLGPSGLQSAWRSESSGAPIMVPAAIRP